MASIPAWWWPAVSEFERRADALIAGKRVRMSNWGRTRSENAAAKGKPTSQHLVWTAADFDGPDMQLLLDQAHAFGLIAIDERNRFGHRPHVHLQLLKAGTLPSWIFDAVAGP